MKLTKEQDALFDLYGGEVSDARQYEGRSCAQEEGALI